VPYIAGAKELQEARPELAGRIMPYRAGYLPEDRRRIEEGLSTGELLGVCATNALELGIDIGDLDATVLTGYPGSIASAWQQAGRSGRRGRGSLSFMIGLANPLDQYFMRHPRDFFDKPHEHALISPSNPYILRPHLLCAAFEWPLAPPDLALFGEGTSEHLSYLQEAGLVNARAGRWYVSPEITYPAEEVNIRSATTGNYLVLLEGSGVVLETIEEDTAFYQVYPGAVYLHQGDSYLVRDLDLQARTVELRYSTDSAAGAFTGDVKLDVGTGREMAAALFAHLTRETQRQSGSRFS